MQRDGYRITLGMLLAAVGVAGWILFNMRLIGDILAIAVATPALSDGRRVLLFAALAWVIGSAGGCALTAICWWDSRGSRQTMHRGAAAGASGGLASWWLATALLCIGYGAYGATLLAALVMGMIGASINGLFGAVIAEAYGWRKRRRQKGAEVSVGPADPSLDRIYVH
jgi:hypothetical protein